MDYTDYERDRPVYANDIFVKVLLDRLAVRIANMINATQSGFRSERSTEEITSLCHLRQIKE